MKRRSVILIALVLFLALGCLVSCEELESNRLIGTWTYTDQEGWKYTLKVDSTENLSLTLEVPEPFLSAVFGGVQPDAFPVSCSVSSDKTGTLTVDMTSVGNPELLKWPYVISDDGTTMTITSKGAQVSFKKQ